MTFFTTLVEYICAVFAPGNRYEHITCSVLIICGFKELSQPIFPRGFEFRPAPLVPVVRITDGTQVVVQYRNPWYLGSQKTLEEISRFLTDHLNCSKAHRVERAVSQALIPAKRATYPPRRLWHRAQGRLDPPTAPANRRDPIQREPAPSRSSNSALLITILVSFFLRNFEECSLGRQPPIVSRHRKLGGSHEPEIRISFLERTEPYNSPATAPHDSLSRTGSGNISQSDRFRIFPDSFFGSSSTI